MKTTTMTALAKTLLAMLLTAVLLAPAATAAYPITGRLGDTLQETDTVGQVVFSWAVDGLKPSSDPLPGYQPTGKIWEATATVHAISGAVTPAVSQFNAVAPNQASYRVLWFVASPTNITGGTIPQGSTATGKIHFDVTGPAPTLVTMNNGMEDLMVWGP